MSKKMKREFEKIDDGLQRIEGYKQQSYNRCIGFDSLILYFTQKRADIANTIGRKPILK